VMEVLKQSGEHVNAGETLLTVDTEDEQLRHELVLKDIANAKAMIAEHAQRAALKKAAVEYAQAAEKEAIAAVATHKGRLDGANALLKAAGKEASDLHI